MGGYDRNTVRLTDVSLRYAAAEIDPGHDIAFRDQLLEFLTETQLAEVEDLIEREAGRRSFHHAATVLREIFRRLEGATTAGAALAYSLGTSHETCLKELGARFEHSKQSVGNHVAVIRRKLDGLAVKPVLQKSARFGPVDGADSSCTPAMTTKPEQQPRRLIHMHRVAKLFRVSRQAIWKKAKEGRFPLKPVAIAGNRPLFDEEAAMAAAELYLSALRAKFAPVSPETIS